MSSRGETSTERRLAIDAGVVRESYKREGIDRVGLIRGTVNPANALTMINSNNTLEMILTTELDETPI